MRCVRDDASDIRNFGLGSFRVEPCGLAETDRLLLCKAEELVPKDFCDSYSKRELRLAVSRLGTCFAFQLRTVFRIGNSAVIKDCESSSLLPTKDEIFGRLSTGRDDAFPEKSSMDSFCGAWARGENPSRSKAFVKSRCGLSRWGDLSLCSPSEVKGRGMIDGATLREDLRLRPGLFLSI